MSKNAIMELCEVSKVYGLNGTVVEALKDANLQLKKGEIIILEGPSGAGKTTLLSVMGLLLHPTSGEILFEETIFDKNTKQKFLTETRSHSIGFIFQAFNLVKSLNVLQNVELMCKIGNIAKNGYKKRCEDILSMLKMTHRLTHMPKDLSGGERQRVAIARALINNPKMIFADEPTGNLDSENGKIIGEYFQEIAQERGTSILIATHDQRLEFCADRIIHMEDGRLLN